MQEKTKPTTGYSTNGLPYLRLGNSQRTVVFFEGLTFENKPPSGIQLRWVSGDYKRWAEDFTVYQIGRKPHLPEGYSTRDMAKDYAVMIRDEIGKPVDVIGLSTGGTMAQYFALDYPELVNHLVLASTGHRLSETGKRLQLLVGELTKQGKWKKAFTTMLDGLYPKGGLKKGVFKLMMWFMAKAPSEPSDVIVTIEAEDSHNFEEFLTQIKVPTLIIGGEEDFFYPISETGQKMPNAQAVIYKGFGHNVWLDNRQQVQHDILGFLDGKTNET